MAHDEKTEQATPRRREKAREKGRLARSRELAGALVGPAGVGLFLWLAPSELNRWRGSLRAWTELSYREDLATNVGPLVCGAAAVLHWILPPLMAVWILALASSFAQGGFVVVGDALVPKLERLSPVGKLQQMFSIAGLSAPIRSLLPFSVLLFLGASTVVRDWELLIRSCRLPVRQIAEFGYSRLLEVGWKSSLVLLAWAACDYLLQRRKLERDLRMSRQEIREEFKEMDGNPTVKARIRRLQRQVRRYRMLKDVERATVVVTNPTHFAVALEYRPQMAAPIVLAKGCDRLAARIREVARWHEVPVIENRPLAQALYRAVEVGQSIPSKLYAAVAEVLAFIYRTQSKIQQDSLSNVRDTRA